MTVPMGHSPVCLYTIHEGTPCILQRDGYKRSTQAKSLQDTARGDFKQYALLTISMVMPHLGEHVDSIRIEREIGLRNDPKRV